MTLRANAKGELRETYLAERACPECFGAGSDWYGDPGVAMKSVPCLACDGRGTRLPRAGDPRFEGGRAVTRATLGVVASASTGMPTILARPSARPTGASTRRPAATRAPESMSARSPVGAATRGGSATVPASILAASIKRAGHEGAQPPCRDACMPSARRSPRARSGLRSTPETVAPRRVRIDGARR